MLYPPNIENKLGFDLIRHWISERCLSKQGCELIETIQFSTHFESIEQELNRVFEFVKIIQNGHEFPTENYHDLRLALSRIRPQGTFPIAEEVYDLKMSLSTLKAIAAFFKSDERQTLYPMLAASASNLKLYPFVYELADRIVGKNAIIRDNASPELHRLRRLIIAKQQQVSKTVAHILRQAQQSSWVDSESQPVIRDGRLLIPVLANHKRQIKGIVHDESLSGKTVFIEPVEAIEINNTIREIMSDEKREIRRILIAFADEIRPYINDLIEAYNLLGVFDFIRAKALLAIWMKATKIGITKEPLVNLHDAVNPVLYCSFLSEKKDVVPLTILLNNKQRILLISGPNAGGKSVALKTVGLLQYMMQCGILIPASESSSLGIFHNIFVDIGDDQSIENDLSTYSSHLQHMKTTLRHCDNKTIVLVDEFGSGTEPIIGGAIAEAILDKLNQKQVFGIITTHYSNLKHYASQTEGIINGAMMFNTAKIEPVFKLEMGKPGGSFAVEIAHKIGLPTDVIENAKQRAGEEHANFDKHLREIIRDKKYWEDKRSQIQKEIKKLEQIIQQQLVFLQEAQKTKAEIREKAKTEAEKMLSEVNKQIEQTIREIRRTQAEKEKVAIVRKEIDALKNKISTGTPTDEFEDKIKTVEKIASKHNIEIDKKQTEAEEHELQQGDYVRLQGQQSIGQIVEISKKTAAVAFGALITTVAPEKLEYVNRAKARKELRTNKTTITLSNDYTKKRLTFKPYIDIRGKYPEEAIAAVQELVDNAIMFHVSDLRILHGRGNGVLRQVVRDYLRTVREIKNIQNEHIEHGGDGITVVKLM